MEADNLILARRTSVNLIAADVDNDAWQSAHAVRLTRYYSGDEAPPSRHAEARILWTPDALCVRFICRQEEALIVSARPQLEQKALGLWDRDVCEIFVAANPQSPHRYLEFEAAPTGEWLDLAVLCREDGRETDWHFNSGMTAAARIDESVITIALCVPWTAFERRPCSGERWRVNLFRCVGAGPERGYLAWQPTHAPQPNFHVPAAFGWLEFNDEE